MFEIIVSIVITSKIMGTGSFASKILGDIIYIILLGGSNNLLIQALLKVSRFLLKIN